jgi:hypothetical protein
MEPRWQTRPLLSNFFIIIAFVRKGYNAKGDDLQNNYRIKTEFLQLSLLDARNNMSRYFPGVLVEY